MPTKQQYTYLTFLFSHYNDRLFAGMLPEPLITICKTPTVASGIFSAHKWIGVNGTIHEISFSSVLFSDKMQLHQTFVHELVHLWQHQYGNSSRNGYHNKEWANKMVEIGLIPTSTGVVGGKKTGQKLSDYPEPQGKFMKAFQEVSEIYIPFKLNN